MKNPVISLIIFFTLISFLSFQCEVADDSVSSAAKEAEVVTESSVLHDGNKRNPSIQEKSDELDFETVRIAFYNVENLFDTIDQPIKLDDEFSPDSDKKWGTERYNDKLTKLSRVFSAMGDGQNAPPIVGLAEVENKTVINDLLKTDAFSASEYGIIHQESPDLRGIDLALVYRKDILKIKKKEFIVATFPREAKYTSRDIVYVESKLAGETLHILINHWPSRYGGQKESEPRRTQVASIVREKVDAIQKKDKNAKVILLGDFNDSPANISLTQVLKADTVYSEADPSRLFNVSFPIEQSGGGSYNYRGQWQLMDQVVVSKSLISEQDKIHTNSSMVNVLREDFMLYKDKRYGPKPNRSYGGPNYYGGYSDHLPIYADLNVPNR